MSDAEGTAPSAPGTAGVQRRKGTAPVTEQEEEALGCWDQLGGFIDNVVVLVTGGFIHFLYLAGPYYILLGG